MALRKTTEVRPAETCTGRAAEILDCVYPKYPPSISRLMVISDIRFLREGLVHALGRADEFEIICSTDDLTGGMALIDATKPDIILVDSALPGGPAVAERLRQHAPQVRLVALGVVESSAEVIAWATAGVCGYVPRTAGLSEVVSAVKEIAQGKQSGSSEVMGALLQWIAEAPKATRPSEQLKFVLTAREQEVAALIEAGLSNKEIARRLGIGLTTTKSHVHNLLGKLALVRRSQVSLQMRRNGGAALRPRPSNIHSDGPARPVGRP